MNHAATAVSNADKITNFALDKIQHLIDAASATLPKATQYALEVVSLQCLISVLDWLVFVPFLLVIGLVVRWLYWKFKDYKAEDHWDDGRWGYGVPAIILFVVWVGVFIAFLCTIPYWSFIGINHPDLYMVHIAMDKILN